MKETHLRVIHSKLYDGKDIVHAQTRRESQITFHCQLDPKDQTLLQEEKELERTVSLRVRNLTNPPPDFSLEPYSSVSKLELSCPVDIPWVFYISSSLPSLQVIRFGTSSFFDIFLFGTAKLLLSKSLLSKSPQVKELVVSFNYGEKRSKENATRLVEVMDSILELSAYFLTGLMKANLTLPLGVNIDGFLTRFPTIRSNGDKREVFKHGYISFSSHSKHSSSSSNDTVSPPPYVKKEEKETKKKDSTPPIKKPKKSTSHRSTHSDREVEPCTSTTRSPRSDKSSEGDFTYSRKKTSNYNTPRSPSLLVNFNEMFTRR